MSQAPKPRPRPVQSTGARAGKPYEKTQAQYREMYGCSLPTIKRWWAKGHPLDDPDLMGEHLSPRGRKSTAGAESERPDPPPFEKFPVLDAALDAMAHDPFRPAEDPRETSLPIALDESFFRGRGVLAAIDRLQKAERERAAAYFAAINERGTAIILANRFKEWIGIVEALRKLEMDAPKVRKANDLTIDKAEVDAAVGQIFSSFRAAANNLPGRAAAKLEGVTERDDIVAVLEREVAVLLRTLTEIALGAVSEAEAAAAETADE